ncbi:MAG: type II secretion system minor pseudopilin GspI [Gammaproteobacteria bacterium]|jgi:general secretion pathway protein I
MHRERGFTLIEVVIALFIVALGLAAAVQLSASSADNARHLAQTTYADWVAMNRLAALNLKGKYPGTGKSGGEAEQAGSTWYWQQVVSDTPIKGLRQVEIRVRAEREGPAFATVRGFIGQAQMAGQDTAGARQP